MFMWLSCRGNLLTNMERVRRDIATSEECGCCARFPESDLHVLRDCYKATEVWLLMVPGRYCSTFFGYGEIKNWMEWNLKA